MGSGIIRGLWAERPGSTFPGMIGPVFRGSWLALAVLAAAPGVSVAAPDPAGYELRADHHPDGIGKFYLGREIAHVMGHQGIDWLERPERETEERPDLLTPALNVQPGQVVADLGAGSGYHTWRLAKAVGPAGRVYAVDIQLEMLDALRQRMAARQVTNVVTVLGTVEDPKLPDTALDLVLLVDVYHEFSHPREMLAGVRRALKPGGRIVLVEFRAEDPKVPIKPLHKLSEAQARRELEANGFEWVETIRTLPWQHVLAFRRGQSGPGVSRQGAFPPSD